MVIRSDVKMLVSLSTVGSATSLHQLEEGACMAKQTIYSYLCIFCKDMKEIRHINFLNRRPTNAEQDNTTEMNTDNGFHGCIGAVDCIEIH